MKKTIIITILVMMFLPMVIAISPAPNGECYVHEPVLLEKIAPTPLTLITNYSDLSERTINITLNNDSSFGQRTFFGSSFRDKVNVNTLTFYDSSGASMNYQDALSNNWIDPIEWTISGLSGGGIPDKFNNFVTNEAYWIESYLAVNLSYTVFGESKGNTLDFVDLRVSNGTDELSIVDASILGWLEQSLRYWGEDDFFPGFFFFKFIDVSGSAGKTFVESYEGVQARANIDNIYLITDNSTEPCKIKVTCNGKFIGNNKVCKPKVHAKYVGSQKIYKPKWFTNHWIRLLGALRETIG